MTDTESSSKPRKKTVEFEPIDQALGGQDGLHHDLVNRLAFAAVNEQRRTRRWSVFFKGLLAIYLAILMLAYLPADWLDVGKVSAKHTALVELNGVISDATEANADTVIEGLRDAFKDKGTAGVILRINSPGGSPVQSGYIYNEIKRLRKLHKDTPLYAVVTDVCASGGYYVAAAADKIYVDKASIVGSIGVRMDSFGFVGSMEKLGVERRLYTSGENKAVLDPFSPSKKSDVDHINKLLGEIHAQFITAVKEGRGERLHENPDLFSGLFWSGEEGVELGLVDALGSSSYVAREVIGVEEIVDFTKEPDLLERISDRIGVAMVRSLNGLVSGNIGGIR
ncbi:MAG: S49 family peptidase [Gammaproteobacteria bacterium]